MSGEFFLFDQRSHYLIFVRYENWPFPLFMSVFRMLQLNYSRRTCLFSISHFVYYYIQSDVKSVTSLTAFDLKDVDLNMTPTHEKGFTLAYMHYIKTTMQFNIIFGYIF